MRDTASPSQRRQQRGRLIARSMLIAWIVAFAVSVGLAIAHGEDLWVAINAWMQQ